MAMGSLLQKLGNFFGTVFKGLFSRWKLSFTMISIVILMFNSIVLSIEERSPYPFFQQVGGKITQADTELYLKSSQIVENKGLTGEMSNWSVVKAIGHLLINVWVLALIFMVVYILLSWRNTSEVAKNLIATLIIVAIIQTGFNFIVLVNMEERPTIDQQTKLIVPFKGVFKLLEALPYITNPDYASAQQQINLNQTITVVSA